MRRNVYNVVLFMFLAGLMFFLWQQAERNLPKPAAKKDEAKPEAVEGAKKDEGPKTDKDGKAPEGPKEGPKEPPKLAPPPPPEPPTLVAMGSANSYLRLLLSTRGAGVQQVILTRFDQADRLGRRVVEKDANGNPTKTGVPLHLIPGVVHPRGKYLREDYRVPDLTPGKLPEAALPELAEPSYTVFHYPTPDDKNPDPLLGERNWKVVSEERPDDGEHRVVFETELGEPYFLKFRKIYTLAPGAYHIGLRVEVEKLAVPGSAKGKGQTRLQISGPRGLPIEGEWYATTYRNAIVGWLDHKGTPRRQLEEAAAIGNKRGGEAVTRGENQFKYMVVATQFFASGVAIDDRADDTFENGRKNPWAYVRATTEIPFEKKQDPGLPYFDDITVRAASETLDLAPGEKVAHSYLLYNGPSKVRLLKLMGENRGKVDAALVDRYKDNLSLQTITDFRSDTWLGRFASFIYWTDLVIVFTNLMHLFLAAIHAVFSSWALSIVVLTVCVRLMLFYPSRKQTAMSMRMMEVQKRLQPQFEALYEKYKDDLHAYNREKTRLMMQNGANPFAAMGGCLLLLAQMPIMMGLYFCLQESVFFRLDSFWWIDNLAAPDMLVWWTEKIPYISTPEDIGSFLYLGPYFNLLPILAVGLMLYQQAKMMPPSTDPQAEQQRMMMKMMMVMMAVFFYKVAAGLALYFIVSTLWGIIERQFIPKPKVDGAGGDGGATADKKPKADSPNGKLSPTATAAVAEAQQKSKGFLGRLREALQKKMEEMQKAADEQAKRQIRNDPNRPDGGPGPGGDQGNRRDRDRDKKKRRRK
ncbi:MAG: YidC/Oxa1 family insertase periplasmic-domain containing protein [Planctomycetes bacterium]|nr:YidC/Oxa1 family insertase periplasmic-domain containing protein [Planctomycetota bacterium]